MKTMHMIGNAHLDPVWLWNWQEGFQENKATMKSVLDRMDEFDDFVFTSSSAQFYEWIENNEPEMFEKIRARIKEGRWKICGGWWVQPDCNVPSGESFVRHGLISQNYFLEKFGVMAHTGYCVDSFGHNSMLPQILKKSGMDNYVFMRPSPEEKPDITTRAFLWKAPDGSSVKVFRIPFAYCTNRSEIEPVIDRCLGEYSEGVDDMMCFYGVGNHGGGPTIENIREIKRLQEVRKDLKIEFSDPDSYFAKIDETKLPVVAEELQYHSPGCYSAESMIKKMNRSVENALTAAETLSVLSSDLDLPVKDGELTKGWKDLLFNQFHDTLAGSAIEAAYFEARNQLGEAQTIADRCTNEAMNRIGFAINIPYQPEKLPLVVFNPNAFAVKAPVEFENGMFSNGIRGGLEIVDSEGNKVESQIIAPSCRVMDRKRITFIAEIPALGYRLYYAQQSSELPEISQDTDPFVMENEILKVTFNRETGAISSIWDKKNGREVLSGSAEAAVIDDPNDTWGHILKRLDDKVGEFTLLSAKVMDCGGVRKAVQMITGCGSSMLTQVYSLYAGENSVHVSAKVNWQEKNRALKLYIPAALDEDAAAECEAPFGFAPKKKEGHEEPMQRWADLSDDKFGLSVLNDGKYGVDFTGNRIGITVLRSPVFAHHMPYELLKEEENEYSYMDQGISTFRYTILPHSGNWRKASTVREAVLLNQPLRTMFETFHDGKLGDRNGYAEISADNVLMTALKKPLSGEGTIMRLVETAGEETEVSVRLMNDTFRTAIKPYEIKTFLIKDGTWQEVSLIEH